MTTEQTIPLNKLFHSAANVRRTSRDKGIDGLAASIAAHGLRQNLNVLPRTGGKGFEVAAGGRRLRALKLLARDGRIDKATPVRCLVLDADDDAAEISLAENAMREAMHPDDQCAAFSTLIEKGGTVEEIAARFGVSPVIVRQRLKLAAVAPALRVRYRRGEMSLDHMMALAISDDHAAQEAAWADLPDWNRSPAALKRALTGGTVKASDRLARFVTLEAYLAAEGLVIRDLFDADDEGYLADAALLQRLAAEKLEAVCETIRAEPWRWVEAATEHDHSVSYGRVYPQDADGEGTAVFDPADMARAGVRVTIGYDGALRIERGLIRPEDRTPEAKVTRPAAAPGGLAAALVTELSAHRTAALRAAVAEKPALALAVMVQALALPLLYGELNASCLTLRASTVPLDRYTKAPGDCSAYGVLDRMNAVWRDRLPGDPLDVLAWCLAQPQETLLDLLAHLTALTVDAVETKGKPRDPAADALSRAVALDMRQSWQPSVQGFWERLSKAAMLAAMAEAKVVASGPLDRVKKAEAAQMVAVAMRKSDWLPAPLREPAT